jgi:hypothetical protein
MTDKEWGDALYVKQKNYISVEMCGGLGNQLFQIAYVYCLGLEYGLEPIFKSIESSTKHI